MPFLATAYPAAKQFFGIGKEATPGTVVLPATTFPVAKGEPDDKPTFVTDTAFRGAMAADYNEIKVSQIADFAMNGPVFLDAVGHALLNVMGDYTATGTSPTSATTVALATSVGATSFTVGAIGSIIIGSVLQFGNAALGTAPTEILVVTNVAGSVVTFANTPLRFAHTTNAAVAIVTAPFTHVFSLLNSGNGQPPTHTVTHYQGISASTGARQYGYWCGSALNFSMDAEQLFTHDVSGTGVLGVIAGSPPTNTISGALPQPSWRFQVGVGGVASGGTLAANIQGAKINIARTVKPWFLLNGQADPGIIARGPLGVEGSFSVLAQDETPLTTLLANNALQLQVTMTNGLAGANLLAVTYDIQTAVYNKATLTDNDHLFYDVGFRCVANTTNVGFSGGFSPLKVTVQNAIPTY